MFKYLKNILRKLSLIKRSLSEDEKILANIVKEKYGESKKDNIFLLRMGQPFYDLGGENRDGPWVNLSNLATWYFTGEMSIDEIINTQIKFTRQ